MRNRNKLVDVLRVLIDAEECVELRIQPLLSHRTSKSMSDSVERAIEGVSDLVWGCVWSQCLERLGTGRRNNG